MVSNQNVPSEGEKRDEETRKRGRGSFDEWCGREYHGAVIKPDELIIETVLTCRIHEGTFQKMKDVLEVKDLSFKANGR